MPIISRRSVRGTPRLGGGPDTNGTPMPAIASEYETTYEAMLQMRNAAPTRMTDVRYAIWYTAGRVRHLVRWHTFVPLEEWDPEEGSMRYIGMVCWHCPARCG